MSCSAAVQVEDPSELNNKNASNMYAKALIFFMFFVVMPKPLQNISNDRLSYMSNVRCIFIRVSENNFFLSIVTKVFCLY